MSFGCWSTLVTYAQLGHSYAINPGSPATGARLTTHYGTLDNGVSFPSKRLRRWPSCCPRVVTEREFVLVLTCKSQPHCTLPLGGATNNQRPPGSLSRAACGMNCR